MRRGVEYSRQDRQWQTSDIQTHLRSCWAAMIASSLPQSIVQGTWVWFEAVNGGIRKPFSLVKHQLHDKSSAVALFVTIARKINYAPGFYELPRPVPVRDQCKFCGEDPPDHVGNDCPANPKNIKKKALQTQFRGLSTEFASYIPWRLLLLGVVGIVIGLQLGGQPQLQKSPAVALLAG